MKHFTLALALAGLLTGCYQASHTVGEADEAHDADLPAEGRATETPPGLLPGMVAPSFTLRNVDGNLLSLNDAAGPKGAIVVFTCNHCPVVMKYEDRIQALDAKYRPMGWPIVAINPNDTLIEPDDSWTQMRVRAQEKRFTFPYLIDEQQTVYPQYGATKTPHVYVLEREGANFRVRYVGAIDDSPNNAEKVKERYVENALLALESNRRVEPAVTKAIGCTIKDGRKR